MVRIYVICIVLCFFQVKSNAYIKRGSLHMQHGKKDEAMDDFQAAEDADPTNADVYHHRGQVCGR